MTQLNLFVNSMPRDLAEFIFFLVVGFTAGTLGIVWFRKISLQNLLFKSSPFSFSLIIDLLSIQQGTRIEISPPILQVQQP